MLVSGSKIKHSAITQGETGKLGRHFLKHLISCPTELTSEQDSLYNFCLNAIHFIQVE